MQESLFNTVKKLQNEEKINVEELEYVLKCDIEEVVKLCKKACLKPKTDSNGNAYFTSEDVSVLKKMKELFSKSNAIQNQAKAPQIEQNQVNLNQKVNFLTKARNRIKSKEMVQPLNAVNNIQHPTNIVQSSLAQFEQNIVSKMSELLSEKMDGFDEIIVELIRSKTENENLRHQVNSLNKQVFILKNELASFEPMAFGLFKRTEKKDI